MELGPKIVQAGFAIGTDVYVVRLVYFLFGRDRKTGSRILFVMANWFYLSMGSRTYVNSF